MPYKDANTQPGQEEHDTHTAALTILVITVLVVVFVAFSSGDGTGIDLNRWNDDEATSAPASDDNLPDIDPTAGSAVPVEYVESTQTSGVVDLPGSLPAAGEITQNTTSQISTAQTQRTIRIALDQPVDAAVEEYRSYLESSGFTISEERSGENALVADGDTSSILIKVNQEESGSSVFINYINS